MSPGDLFNAYLREIPARRALSADAERELVERIAAGRTARQRLRDATLTDPERAWLHEAIAAGEDARQRLITEHLPLVVALARPYAWRGVAPMDLVQEGNVALLQAIEKFDPQRGVRLATYAAWWIRHAIGRALADQGRPVRLPARLRRTLIRLRRAYAQLAQQLGREPTEREIATQLGVDTRQITELLPLLESPLSLDAPLDAEDEAVLADVVTDPDAEDVEELVVDALAQDYIRMVLAELAPRERQVLALRYGLDDGRFRAPEEVAAQLGLRRDEVRRIEGRALRKLRDPRLTAYLVDDGGLPNDEVSL
jgi:RNA polymerase sigma factor (sigma-70 family)